MWPFTKRTPIRRALDPETNQPIPMPHDRQWLQGKLTYVSLALTAAGAIGKMFGWHLPTDEAQDFLTWLAAHWDDLSQGVGLAGAAYGKARAEWRRKQQLHSLTPMP